MDERFGKRWWACVATNSSQPGLLGRGMLAVVVGAVVGFAFWYTLQKVQHNHIRRLTRFAAQVIKDDIADEIRFHVQSQVQFAWVIEGGLSRREWDSFARLFLESHPGYLALALTDTASHVRFSCSAAQAKPYLDALFAAGGPLEQALQEDADKRNVIVSPVLLAANGESAHAVLVPIHHAGNVAGFVIVIFDDQKVLQDALADQEGHGYAFAVFEGNHELFRSSGRRPEYEARWGQDAELSVSALPWRVRVWPQADLLGEVEPRLPELALISGATIGLFFFIALDLARTLYKSSRELRLSQERLQTIIASAMDAIITVDEDQRIVLFNESAEKIFRCPSDAAIGKSVNDFIPERFREAHRQHIRNFGLTGVTSRAMDTSTSLWGRRAADGKEFPIEASISQAQTQAGKLYTVIVRDISVREQAEAALRLAHEKLELRVQERTAELHASNARLEAEIHERQRSEECLKDLSGHLLRLRDEEQRRIARELHDSTAQILGALAGSLERLHDVVDKGDFSKAPPLLAQSRDLAERATADVRSLSHLLHPPILDDFGLPATLRWYTTEFSSRTGVAVQMDIEPELGRFPHELELTLFRILQEALSNAYRHSGSATVDIAAFRTKDEVTLQISDHGRGIPSEILGSGGTSRAKVGIGIAGMRERVRQMNGRLEIESGAIGTHIKVVLPIAATAVPDQDTTWGGARAS